MRWVESVGKEPIPALGETLDNNHECDQLGYSPSFCTAGALDEILGTIETRIKVSAKRCKMRAGESRTLSVSNGRPWPIFRVGPITAATWCRFHHQPDSPFTERSECFWRNHVYFRRRVKLVAVFGIHADPQFQFARSGSLLPREFQAIAGAAE